MRSLCLFSRTARIAGLFVFVISMLWQSALHGQVGALIVKPVDETKLKALPGNVSPKLKGAKDMGAADVAQPSGRLMMVLNRSVDKEAALQTFLQQAQDLSSPNYHKWLTPAAFAQQYGAADSDIQQVTGWLQSHGLKIAGTAAGKGTIEFSGTIGQVNEAFHTSIHQYSVKGETHYANMNDPSIPVALAPVVAGVTQLNDFHPTPQYKLAGRALYDPKTHTGKPQWTIGEGAGNPSFYLLTPEDFSTQYDVKPTYAAGITGKGQTIGIINASNIDISLVNAYRKLFGLSYNPPQIVIDGNDPGILGADAGDVDVEAYLDVENAGAVAPDATVNLYIAGSYGELGDGGLFFSMVRAVNDDVARVLSSSFGVCEESSTSQNQFINSLWEQAAAQGQTVLVSAGDSGAFGCYGLGVNGFASTPWNISVGGTDAYFADYTTGGASIASYWSDTNDANLGSLQKVMTEQVWNGTQFGLNSITYDPVEYQPSDTGAGGGGASKCAVGGIDPASGDLDCISGYPKPSWQVGKGVPNDGVRDQPDVSLFASNGYNGVEWPICSEAGDCVQSAASNNGIFVTGIGGTSASAPAMAGIMALINQKYGPQGQANNTLYALAAQYPTSFNDITLGSNNEPCPAFEAGSNDCTKDPNDSYYSLQEYPAGFGYDLASGLGTVDVNQMLTNWSNVSFKSSATTLTLTPATITHGQNVTANVAVTGTGTPTGAVALVSSTTLPNNKGITAINLGSAGTGSEAIGYMPGGTYTVVGRYSGDGINAPSQSSPVTITVTPEQSTLMFTPQYLTFNTDTYSNVSVPITANAQVPYGSNVVLDVQIAGANGTVDGNATGTVMFTNGTSTLGTVSVSSAGTAEFNASLLAPGTYTIGGTYSGDASYKSATFGPLAFSIVKSQAYLAAQANPAISVNYVCTSAGCFPGIYNYQTGSQATLEIFANPALTLPQGLQPTGTITYQLGTGATQTAMLVPQQNYQFQLTSGAAISFPVTTGTTPLNVIYGGDANYLGGTLTLQIVGGADTLLNSTTTFTVTPSNFADLPGDTIVTAQATVTGTGMTAPTGNVLFQLGNFLNLGPSNSQPVLTPGTGNTSTASIQFRAADPPGGAANFIVNYLGDTVYAPSSSAPAIFGEDDTDFSIQTQTPNLAIASGATGVATLNLTPLNGFSGPVTLSCSAPASMMCSVTSSVTVSGSGTTTAVKLTAAVQGATTAKNQVLDWRKTGGGAVLACVLILIVPKRRRFGRMLLSFVAVSVMLGALGCGESVPSTPITPKPTDTPAGTYAVLITGASSSGTIHNISIMVIVQ